MAAQILAVIIFIVMFGLIIWDHIERHIVSLGCGLLTLVLVFGVCMHSEAAAAEDTGPAQLHGSELLVSDRGGGRVLERHQLGDDSFYCRYDADGGGHGARGIFPVAVPDNRRGGTL
ncbi:MAG: hypothetical protein ACLTR6_11045 [Clostridium fessum]